MSVSREFVLRGKRVHLTSEDFRRVAESVKNVHRCPRVKYYVEIEDQCLPVKDLVLAVLQVKEPNITRQDFTTEDAVRILKKFGFVVKEKRGSVPVEEILRNFAGVLSIGGNALEDEAKLYTR